MSDKFEMFAALFFVFQDLASVLMTLGNFFA